MPIRKANATWEGGLKAGTGSYKTETGVGGAYGFSSRFESGSGSNPEELLAAAHAACFSMALSGGLEKNGTPATRVQTEAQVAIEKLEAGFRITRIKLVTRATVPGLDAATFQKIALDRKDNCPVSVALKAVPIELDAQLA
jgi:osmotically inducible protein OsmC